MAGTDMESLITNLIDAFNKRVSGDPKLREHLEGKQRTISVELPDGTGYHFFLRQERLDGFGKGAKADAEVRIITDTVTLKSILQRETKPMKAYATGKLKLKASLGDLLTLRRLFEEK